LDIVTLLFMTSYRTPFTQLMEFIILWLREPHQHQMTKSFIRLQFTTGTQLQLLFTIGTQLKLQLQFTIGTQLKLKLHNGIHIIKLQHHNGMDLHKPLKFTTNPQDGTVPLLNRTLLFKDSKEKSEHKNLLKKNNSIKFTNSIHNLIMKLKFKNLNKRSKKEKNINSIKFTNGIHILNMNLLFKNLSTRLRKEKRLVHNQLIKP
jgi:hypothetical protein